MLVGNLNYYNWYLCFRFSGQTLSSNCLVLLTITKQESSVTVCVNCEKMVVGSVFLNEIKGLLSQ